MKIDNAVSMPFNVVAFIFYPKKFLHTIYDRRVQKLRVVIDYFKTGEPWSSTKNSTSTF